MRYTLAPMLLLSAFLATVHAAPIGDPVPLVDEGRFIVGTRIGSESLWEQDAACEAAAGESCGGTWRHGGYAAVGRIVIIDGLAIDAELGWMNDKLRQANFEGAGVSTALGLRGAIPMGTTGWWISGVGRYEAGRGSNETTDAYEESTYRLGTVAGTLAWRDTNISAWGGGQGTWMWEHSVEQRTVSTDTEPLYQILLETGFPISGVFGFEVISEPLGPGWTTDWRLSVGAEGSLGLSQGAHFWVAFRY
jgi:hypothetical protein